MGLFYSYILKEYYDKYTIIFTLFYISLTKNKKISYEN